MPRPGRPPVVRGTARGRASCWRLLGPRGRLLLLLLLLLGHLLGGLLGLGVSGGAVLLTPPHLGLGGGGGGLLA